MTDAMYFFVSYAHLPPRHDPVKPEAPITDDDPVVSYFFEELSEQVRRRAAPGSRLAVGFYDRSVPTGEDLKAALVSALGRAEVLVPLYSPRYLDADWPMSEHRSFLARLHDAGGDTAAHVQPVLWIPLPPGAQLPEGTDLSDLGAGSPDYMENGLRMLHELGLYRDQYHEFVSRLAQRIVEVAETRPIGPSPAPPLASAGRVAELRFVIAVLAPKGADWRPFGERSPALVQQAVAIAERLGLSAVAVELPESVKEIQDSPAAVLIDPVLLDLPNGRSLVEETLRGLSPWAIPIVVADLARSADPKGGEKSFRQAAGMLARAESSRIPRGTSDPDGFAEAMPLLVSQARRRYLQRLPATFEPRDRLTDVDQVDRVIPRPSSPGADER